MEVCGEDVASLQSVAKQCVDFQSRTVRTEDCERSSSPTTAGTADRSAFIDIVIHNNVKTAVGKLQHDSYLSHGTLTRHDHSDLGSNKVCVHWVPQTLMENHKSQ
jgi:hypothetical protein